MATTIYNGLLYTTKEINRNSRIKINGIVDGKKVNKLVGVKGLIELIGVEMANKVLCRAFNKVGDAYIDITFEFALHENPSIYEYVTFGEYDAKTIRKAVLETGYYGGIYNWLYYKRKK